MHTVFALLCFVVVIHWLIFPYPSGLLHWHCGNLTIAPVPAKQPWWIWINTSCEFIMNDCVTTTKQSTTKPCAYFLGYTVHPTFCRDVIHYPCARFNSNGDNRSQRPNVRWDATGMNFESIHVMERLCQVVVSTSPDQDYHVKKQGIVTSSNGNIFRVTVALCWKSTGHRRIPLTKGQ